jgi:hypothetical protein
VPINPPRLSEHKPLREHAPVETEDEDADQDANEMDEMYVHPN